MAASSMSDKEWEFFERFVVKKGPKRGRQPRNHRRVLDAVFWVAQTGSSWRDLWLHHDNWGSVYRQFRRWTLAGIWDVMLAELNDADAEHDIDRGNHSTRTLARQRAARVFRDGMRTRILAALVVASRPPAISPPAPRLT